MISRLLIVCKNTQSHDLANSELHVSSEIDCFSRPLVFVEYGNQYLTDHSICSSGSSYQAILASRLRCKSAMT